MIHLFCGYDPRESIGYHVFCHSVISKASVPVSFIPLSSMGMAEGSNAFTMSRFLIPYLMGFKGWAIFADASDMLMDADISELASLFNPEYAAQVVKHDYKTKHRTKYRGTDMECPNLDYPRKNWASLMLINCEHPSWSSAGPVWLKILNPMDALQLSNCLDEEIGELPDSWNRLVDEGQDVEGAKLLHWTAGVPAFEHYKNAPGAEKWHAARAEAGL